MWDLLMMGCTTNQDMGSLSQTLASAETCCAAVLVSHRLPSCAVGARAVLVALGRGIHASGLPAWAQPPPASCCSALQGPMSAGRSWCLPCLRSFAVTQGKGDPTAPVQSSWLDATQTLPPRLSGPLQHLSPLCPVSAGALLTTLCLMILLWGILPAVVWVVEARVGE